MIKFFCDCFIVQEEKENSLFSKKTFLNSNRVENSFEKR